MKKPPFTIKPYHAAKRPALKYVVRGKINGKPQAKFFTNEAEAKTFAHLRNGELFEHGRAHVEFPPWLRIMAQRCQERLSAIGKTLDDATEHFIKYYNQAARSLPIEKLFEEAIEAKKRVGVTKEYLKCLRILKARFCKSFPGKLASEFTTKEIGEWLESLIGLGNATRNTKRTLLVTIFEHAKKKGYCEKNAVREVETYKTIQTEIGILKPEELILLLAHADPRILPAVAIGAFAGIRTAELARLDWADVDLDGGYVNVRAKNAKSSKRRIVKIQPCLDAWLRPFKKEAGKVLTCISHFEQLKRKACASAGIKNCPRNSLRHSFASYHLAHFKDTSALALEMGHSDNSLIFAHYREVVRPADAIKFWNAFPGNGEAKDVSALKPEAFKHSWYIAPKYRQWSDGKSSGMAWFVNERIRVCVRVFRTKEAADEYAAGLAATTGEAPKVEHKKWKSGERWTVGRRSYPRTKQFQSEREAQAHCDEWNARHLAQEVDLAQAVSVSNVLSMHDADKASAA